MVPYYDGGQFTLTTELIASGVQVESPFGQPDYIEATSMGTAANPTYGWGRASVSESIQWFWEKPMPQDYAKGILQGSHASIPPMYSQQIATNGFRSYNTANPPTYAALATTAITGSAGTYVATMASTGSIQVGDWVRLYGTTGELEIAGYPFQVTALTANVSITLGYMATGGLSLVADATAGSVVKYIPSKFYPRHAYLANITQAAQCKAYFTGKNDYTTGEILSFRVSSDFGMLEMNNKRARVLSVVNTATESSVTLDLDSTGFTAFAFPLSATAAAGVSPAMAVPSSSGVVPLAGSATNPAVPEGTNLLDAFDNRHVHLVNFGSGLFNVSTYESAANDIWSYKLIKYGSRTSSVLN